MMRLALLNAVFLASTGWSQTTPGKAVFEAAAIKPADPAAGGSSSWNTDEGRFRAVNQTLKSYIMIAYDVKNYQVTSGPNWLDSDHYDITAKLDAEGDDTLPPKSQSRQRNQAIDARHRQALQVLLAERFQLKFHRETKNASGYGLVIAKSGLKIKPVDREGGSSTSSNGHNGVQKVVAQRVNMDRIASLLMNALGQPVVDMTHNEDFYTFNLDWMRENVRDAARDSGSSEPALPSLFTAVQEQLGLKLESQKVPVDIIVVDSAEKPSEN
jgi:uncharacterized protein (TIGR03435 family)